MHDTTTQRSWLKRAGVRLMPVFEGAVTVLTVLQAAFWLCVIVAAIGFYVVAVILIVPVCLLLMRMGGWRLGWKELFKRKAKS